MAPERSDLAEVIQTLIQHAEDTGEQLSLHVKGMTRKTAKAMRQNANRAANLVRQLLAFSRQQTLQPRVLVITDVLAELSHLLRRLIGADIELDMVHGRDLWQVKVDKGQLEQVITNLTVNARDAVGAGGAVTIRTGNIASADIATGPHPSLPPANYVMLEVSDTGEGIPKEPF